MALRVWRVAHWRDDTHSPGAGITMPEPQPAHPVALVVEDDEAIRALIAIFFPRFGIDVRMASTVAQAIQVATDHHVDCAVLDLHLGPDSGVDVLVWLRAHPRYTDTPVVILSGLQDFPHEAATTMLQYGAVSVSKPMSYANLCATLKRMIADGHRGPPC